jgi:hypothetical protein
MKFYVDITESISLGNRICDLKNLKRTQLVIENQIRITKNDLNNLNKIEEQENEKTYLQSEIKKQTQVITELNRNYNLVIDMIEIKELNSNKDILEAKLKKEQKKLDHAMNTCEVSIVNDNITRLTHQLELVIRSLQGKSKYDFPNYTDNLLVIGQSNLNQYVTQGDFLRINTPSGKPYLCELAATWATLQDKVLNPYPLQQVYTQAQQEDIIFDILVVLPESDEDNWFAGSKITKKDLSNFRRNLNLPVKVLRVPNVIYNEPSIHYFEDEPLHRSRLKEKQKMIFEEITRLSRRTPNKKGIAS